MQMPEWGNASLLEIAWTILGIFGVGFSFAGLRDALTDRAVVAKTLKGVNNTLSVVANSAVRNERAILGFQAIFAFVGLLAILLPSGGEQDLTWIRLFLGVALLAGEGLAVWNSLQNRLDRRKVLGWDAHDIVKVSKEESVEEEEEK